MADRGDTHYHVPTLNKWFAFSSLLMLIAAFWMVVDDWQRPWKHHQKEFNELELDRANAALAAPEAVAAIETEDQAKEALRNAEEELEKRQTELEELEDEVTQKAHEAFVATEEFKMAQQIYNWERWGTEEDQIHHLASRQAEEKSDLTSLIPFELDMNEKAGVKQEADFALAAATQKLKEFQASVTAAELDVKQASKSIELARKKRDSLDPEDFPTQLANIIRDFPGLDFIGPNLQVKKVVLEDLTFELNFTKKKRIDMCTTCHLAADRAGYENEAQPYASHPRLDLYLTAKSPHPFNKVGCTICHRGSGEALDFTRADHRPTNEAEGDEWYEATHWHKQHHWDYPMLESNHIEGSCVQCHKDTMELIAKDAPKVTEGYRNFERFGCYACHKVEWFPTKRRPGPSLKGIKGKTNADWMASWIAKPRDFRPTTWMPQIFHLENYAPEEVVVTSEYGKGREIMGQEWNETAVAAVSSYIWGQGQTESFPALPVEGNVDKGREAFHLVGCLSCHNVAPYEGDGDNPAEKVTPNNGHGPNLRGVATKITAEWLFAWLKDPAAYWSETRMPDLRLSDEEAADITAYIMEDPDGYFTDVPQGWNVVASPFNREVLEEQARWFFNRTSRQELTDRFSDEWADDQTLLKVVGEKYVLNQGCHSCHEIQGLENAQPIGAELTTWSTKTVDKLDWGFMHEYIARDKGWTKEKLGEAMAHHKVHELKAYREPWLAQKLHAPRSFDRDKRKNPTEKLRMPWFDFTPDEIDSIVTFVAGLVVDEVQRAKMVPTHDKIQMNKGLQAIRQKNCAACHSIEPGMVEFMDNDGNAWKAHAQVLAFEGELLPPPSEGFAEYVAEYVDYMRSEDMEDDPEWELPDMTVQLLETVPGLGKTGQLVVTENVASVKPFPGWGGDFVNTVAGFYLDPWARDQRVEDSESDDAYFQLSSDPDYEGRVQDVDGEYRFFGEEPYDKVRWTYAPPVLWDEGEKLQREWFYRFLKAPVKLRQQLRVRMPTFNYADGEAGAIADYFAHAAAKVYPKKFARDFLADTGMDTAQAAAKAKELNLKLSQAQLEGIVDGDPVSIAAAFGALETLAATTAFEKDPATNPAYETIPQREPEHIDRLLAAHPNFFGDLDNLVKNGPKCVQCHFLLDESPTADQPIAWAPNLDLTRERLRPSWTRTWLVDPGKVYPGTAMPANFTIGESNWQEFWPKPSAEQIEDVLSWLYNL